MPANDAYEWLDGNMHRSYPIADSCTCEAASGIMLPSSFLVDMDINVPLTDDSTANERFFVSAILRHGAYVTVEISFHTVAGTDVVCARSDPISLTIRNTNPITGDAGQGIPSRTITLAPVAVADADYKWLESLTGSLVVGTCADMQDIGNLAFPYQRNSQEVSTILSVRVHLVDAGITSITAIGTNGTTSVIHNNMILQAGDGVDFETSTAVDGTPVLLIKRRPMDTDYQPAYSSVEDVIDAVFTQIGHPITTINGLPPTEDGNFQIDGDDCTTVTESGDHSLFIQNPCAKPCCTDDTPEDVETAIATLTEGEARLQEYYQSISALVNSLQAKLASLIVSGRSS